MTRQRILTYSRVRLEDVDEERGAYLEMLTYPGSGSSLTIPHLEDIWVGSDDGPRGRLDQRCSNFPQRGEIRFYKL